MNGADGIGLFHTEFFFMDRTTPPSEEVLYREDVDTGVMIEVPSAAIISDILAREVDFFSIGTNDLIQYTLAVDRINEKLSDYYDPLNPAIIRLIELTCKNASYNGIPAGMCGAKQLAEKVLVSDYISINVILDSEYEKLR